MFWFVCCYSHEQLTVDRCLKTHHSDETLTKVGFFKAWVLCSEQISYVFGRPPDWNQEEGVFGHAFFPGQWFRGFPLLPCCLTRELIWGLSLSRCLVSSNKEVGCKAYASSCSLKESAEMGKNRKRWEKGKTLCIFAPSFQSPKLFVSRPCTAFCMCKTYSIVPMLVIILFLLFLPSLKCGKQDLLLRSQTRYPNKTNKLFSWRP